jgi:hypothetical protein
LTSTRWSYDDIAILFLAENYHTVICLGLNVPEEISAYGMMTEPLYGLIKASEDRKSCFHMCAVMTDRFYNEMDRQASTMCIDVTFATTAAS